jgi:hypothetical protein
MNRVRNLILQNYETLNYKSNLFYLVALLIHFQLFEFINRLCISAFETVDPPEKQEHFKKNIIDFNYRLV